MTNKNRVLTVDYVAGPYNDIIVLLQQIFITFQKSYLNNTQYTSYVLRN